MEKAGRVSRKTPLAQNLTGKAPPPERAGTVIRMAETEYKLIDPKTGGIYILKTQTPWTDEKIIKHINFLVRKSGRVEAGETMTMESPK